MSDAPNERAYTIRATKRNATHYIAAADGSLLHTEFGGLYALMVSLLKMGWKRIVSEELEKRGDHYVRIGTCTMTPPKRNTPGVANVELTNDE